MTKPKPSQGKKPAVVLSCVAWVDLLGYGSLLQEGRFDINDVHTRDAITRLRSFHRVAVGAAARSFKAMPINDGVAYFVDLGAKSNSVAADFLQRAVRVFEQINRVDQGAGYPGARMVISVGPRAKIGRPKRSDSHLSNIVRRLREGSIDLNEALREAFVANPVAGFVPALQANFGFTRAYLVNEGGSARGFAGPTCYIDLALFNRPLPAWIQFRRTQEWVGRGFTALFGEYAKADWVTAGAAGFQGMSTTGEIASALGVQGV